MQPSKLRSLALGLLMLLTACAGNEEPAADRTPEDPPSTSAESPDAADEVEVEVRLPGIKGDEIPVEYTCEGNDTPPDIEWEGPVDASEWIVSVTDPDAPGGTFVHWVVYRIPPGETELSGRLPPGAFEATSSFGNVGYGGPCPPEGDDPHGYVFTVTALSEPLDLR
ncbi:MAG TPA: YbhB/YbcL family Raf kinase inhibitor-like protein, partial [Actinomycetota bacterium]|nr:YbhB/YbcL family Raf kinase inhibitor-like protein [Actinomycetota bacterium]